MPLLLVFLHFVEIPETFFLWLFLLIRLLRALKRSCALSKEGALSPIFEGDMPP
jgi:hypothetical protein